MQVKKIIVGGVASLALGSFVVGALLTIQDIPDNEKLKVSVSAILDSKIIPSYSYTDDDGKNVTVPEIVEYTYKDKVLAALPNEDISKRTRWEMVFYKGNETQITIDAGNGRYSDGVDWWTIGTATTTKASYDLQTIVSFLGTPAYAQTFLTSGAGSGNQTWNVPADWNDANNTIECIGSGGKGADGVIGASTGAGGGGGEYRKTTNLDLTPSGTATYSVGAYASTSNSMLHETYFNSTASTTASISCGFGQMGVAAVGGKGGTGGTGATANFNGGNGGVGEPADAQAGAGGGGGSAGPIGIGQTGGAPLINVTNNAGGGGGGSNGGSSTVGGEATATTGGAGGHGTSGAGGGAGGVADTSAGANGPVGGGGGGGASTLGERHGGDGGA